MKELDALLDDISVFLVERSGYERLTAELQMLLIPCIVSGQYVMQRNNGEITAFLCYWKLTHKNMQLASKLKQPQRIDNGNQLYIVEAGNTTGNMRNLVNELRTKEPYHIAIACHRKGRFTIKRQSGRR